MDTLSTVLRVVAGVCAVLLRGLGKVIITIWRLAGALDSALWRACKLMSRRAWAGAAYVFRLVGLALRSLLLWMPTRTGRAYSAGAGVVLVVALLAIVDELRAVPDAALERGAQYRAPIDRSDPILVRIEGRYVHLSEIQASALAAGLLRPDEVLTPETAFERELVEVYVEERLLARAALDEGLQRTPSVSRRVNAARDRVLASAYINARLSEAVTPEAVRRMYDNNAGVTALGDEVRARHIVVETEEEAAAILAELEGGADFASLARQKSIDRATAPLGGQVGWFTRAMMTPAFSRAAFDTAPESIAPPFETEFGWHVLEVISRRPTEKVPFAEVSEEIETFLRRRIIDSTLRALEEEKQVVYFRVDPEASQSDQTTFPAGNMENLEPQTSIP